MCFGCSKELSHRYGSFEYIQHMFWLRNKKNNVLLCTLIWGSALRANMVTDHLDSIASIQIKDSINSKTVQLSNNIFIVYEF